MSSASVVFRGRSGTEQTGHGMRAFRILLAGWGMACGSASVSAQSPLFSTKPTQSALTFGQLPAMSTLTPTAGLSPQPIDAMAPPATGLAAQAIPGAVYSPWCGDRPAGGDGVGANGPVTYELYARSGPSILGHAGGFNGALQTGWVNQIGSRTLLFNQAGDAAWTLDLGLGNTYNRGNRLDHPVLVEVGSLKGADPSNTDTIPLGIRNLRRTSLNVGLGRDWFLNGPGSVGQTSDTNWRFGTDVGGRWGTASVGYEPVGDPGGYRRHHGVYTGVYLGTALNWEKDFGGWILLAGVRAEWTYNWTNLIPPLDGNIQDINIMFSLGVRF